MSKFKKASLLICSTVLAIGLVGCGKKTAKQSPHHTTHSGNATVVKGMSADRKLADLNYRPNTNAFVNVNHGRSDLSKSWKHDHVNYHNLDNLNRTGTNTGWLDKANVANDSLRTRQIVKPTGYHQKFVHNEAILNRGHEIAYSLSKGIAKDGKYDPKAESGDQNNPKNLFTQTAFSNQELQTIYESKVRHALEHGEHVIYQVTPVFKGDDLMAKGVHMQAKSTNGKLNFNVYLFNVQPKMAFNYKTGTSRVDNKMKVKTPKNAPHFHDNPSTAATYHNRRSYRPRGYYHYPRRHHFIRHAAEGYAAYRIGKHFGRRGRMMRTYHSSYHYRPNRLHRTHFFNHGLHRNFRRF